MKRALRLASVALAALLLAGCASVGIDEALGESNANAQQFTKGKLEISRTEQQRDQRAALTDDLLSKRLSQDDAVQVTLANSPSLQALLSQGWADIAAANQTGRLANPIFTFERMRLDSELELGRLLSIIQHYLKVILQNG